MWLGLLLAQVALVPNTNTTPPGTTLAPAVTVSQLYDDELAPPGSGADEAMVTRVTPQMSASYRSPRVDLSGFGSVDADVYAVDTGRSSPWARGTASATADVAATERLHFAAGASLWSTTTPGEIRALPGIDPGLVGYDSEQGNASTTYRATPLTDVSLRDEFVRTNQSGLATYVNTFAPGATTQATPLDTLRVDTLLREIAFDGHGSVFAWVPRAGWTHRWENGIALDLIGGPRLESGSPLDAELSASLRWDTTSWSLSGSYLRAEQTVPGVVGTVAAQSGSLAATGRVSDRWTLGADASLYASHGAPLQAVTLEVGASASYRLTDRATLSASLRRGWQQIELLAGAPPIGFPDEHTTAVISVSFAAVPPQAFRPVLPGAPSPDDEPKSPEDAATEEGQ